MRTLVMGAENEYAIAAVDGAAPVSVDPLRLVFAEAGRQLKSLSDGSRCGMFLVNGGRMYLDCGHVEIATPECTSPWEVTRYILAGEKMLHGLAASASANQGRPGGILVFRTNVDYRSPEVTWGAHESYRYLCPAPRIITALIPHLVTRMIYTGGGGLDVRRGGFAFSLSPRAGLFRQVTSLESTGNRGIWHLKDETLSGEGHRAHVLLGEALCSHRAQVLKLGTTALLAAMADGSVLPGRAVQLLSPVSALRTVAADVALKAPIALADGRWLTPLAIQRFFLESAERCVGERFMPDWTAEVCRLWRETLDVLEGGAAAAATLLDWPLKYQLYTRRLTGRGHSWESARIWSFVARVLSRALRRQERVLDPNGITELIGSASPVPREVAFLALRLRRYGLDWSGLAPFLKLRDELCEADLRFGQIGNGVFDSLDAARHLRHKVPGVDRIDRALLEPSSCPRARRRSKAIRELLAAGSAGSAGWVRVSDETRHRILELPDPLSDRDDWIALPRPGNAEQPREEPAAQQGSSEPEGALARLIREFLGRHGVPPSEQAPPQERS
jgi:hypothetical protein